MRRHRALVLLAIGLAMALIVPASPAQGPVPVGRAVLFFSPTCGHCEFVIQEVLPGVFEARGGPWDVSFDETLVEAGVAFYLLSNGTLEFLLVDVTIPDGFALFEAATDAFAIGNDAVPRLIVSNQVMIGSQQIPERLPGVLDAGLEADGIDWPAIPGLSDALETIPPEAVVPAPQPTVTSAPAVSPATTPATVPATTPTTAAPSPTLPLAGDSLADRFGRDRFGNTLAVVVLVAMLGSLVVTARVGRRESGGDGAGAAIPVVAVAGLVVAGYLSYVELGSYDAACGPVGDCNAVQQSDYARIAGIPIGVVGLLGYGAALVAWIVQRVRTGWHADVARILLLGGAVLGVAFSAYLTFLEPFVIGATCVWCLSSAVLTMVLMLLALRPGVASWRRIRRGSDQLQLQV